MKHSPLELGLAARVLRLILALGFVVELFSAILQLRHLLMMMGAGHWFGSNSHSTLPGSIRIQVWLLVGLAGSVIVVLEGHGARSIRERLTRGWHALVGASPVGSFTKGPWTLRRFWRVVTLSSVAGAAFLFLAGKLRPQGFGMPGLHLLLEIMVSVGMAGAFLLTALLMENVKPEPSPLPATASVAPNLTSWTPVVAHSLHESTGKEATCAVCQQPSASARCPACGAAMRAGGFLVSKLLAQSAYSRTYLSYAPDGSLAVLKEVSFALAPDVSVLDGFEREGQLLRQLRDPRVPRFLASFTEGKGAALRYYVAYAYIEGMSLAAELSQRRYAETDTVDLARDVLNILDHLHTLSPPLVHRDVKPSNLLRQPNGSVALVDFGTARDLTRTTGQATMVGTFGYMPREQLGGQVDVTSDLYALGMTLLHLLTRRPPWAMLDETGQLVFPRDLRTSVPFRRFLQRLTAPRRKDRYRSAREALRALEAPTETWGPWLRLAGSVVILAAGVMYVLYLLYMAHQMPGN